MKKVYSNMENKPLTVIKLKNAGHNENAIFPNSLKTASHSTDNSDNLSKYRPISVLP